MSAAEGESWCKVAESISGQNKGFTSLLRIVRPRNEAEGACRPFISDTDSDPFASPAAQHGEIIESSYLLGEKGPKSTWTKVLEMVVLLATVGGCAYLFLFLFHHGNHHPASAKESASHPHTPVGASSSSSKLAACDSNPGCAKLGERGGLFCPRFVNRVAEVVDSISCSAAVQLLWDCGGAGWFLPPFLAEQRRLLR